MPFQSTSPVWRTTNSDYVIEFDFDISIHVPRVEDDLRVGADIIADEIFQSTSPVWRTTSRQTHALTER